MTQKNPWTGEKKEFWGAGYLSGGSRRICTLLLFLLFSLFAFSLEWPASEGTLLSNFASPDGGIPALGDSFSASGAIYPSDVGKLIFVHEPDSSPSRLPSPLGSWVALDHGDNLVGIYGRYESSRDVPVPAMVEKNTVLATAGRSGWAGEGGFYFAFFDRSERRWINPSIIISNLEDNYPPLIRQVELRNVAGTSFNPASIRSLPQGLYTVYVDTVDTIAAAGKNLAPNRIICSINGVEAGALSFETLISKNGERMVYRNGIVPAAQVYDSGGFGLGEVRFTRGQATLTIEARDIAGNSRSLSYRLTVE
ncbi:MAG: hypothetical protein LBE02_05075 [Spirochaetaceae bacterium]|jgi:hypothetical protein|nr:hypothetical protein [Spirochaetaceae bacterium]